VSHANAALTPRARLRLARYVVEEGHTLSQASTRFEVSYRTAQRWVDRYLALGETGMHDRSSRPHRILKTPPKLVRRIVSLRRRKRWGPVEIGDALGLPASTVHAVLKRCRLNRLSHLDRLTGEPVRRYEHEHPGDLLHVDVKKLGNIPDGGGWRHVGRVQGLQHRQAMANAGLAGRNQYRKPTVGTAFVHTAIDDHSRVAYAEIHDDETAATAAAVLHRAVAWFADRGVTVTKVLSDNGGAYRSFLWRDTCAALGITRSGPGPTDPRPTARSNASTAPSAAGPSTPSTPQKPPAAQHCQHGCTTTTTTGPTPPSDAEPPSPA
jgi:transposase